MRDSGESVAEYYAIAFCDIQEEELIGILRCSEKTRGFHVPIFTFHVMTNQLQANLL